jgi:recombination protein RecA
MVEDILKKFRKKFSEDDIKIAKEVRNDKEEVVSTGILTVDYALGIGGLPLGKIYELYGQESSGKTSLSLIIASQMQKKGKTCAFIDAENSFDPDWAATLGVDIDNLIIVNPMSLEDSLDKVEFLISNGVGFIVYDSVVAAPTVSQNSGEYGDTHVGVRARVLSNALSKMIPVLRKNLASILFINQVREKIGVYGNPETTPGGRALKFFSSIRMNTRKRSIKGEEFPVGDEIFITIEKNKFAPPQRKAKFLLFYDGKYSIDYVELLQKLEIVEKTGAWYNEKVTGKRFHGASAMLEEIMNNQDYKNIMEQKIKEKISSVDVLSENDHDE